MKPLVLGTRASALALAQTALVEAALRTAAPEAAIEVREIKTTGDKRLDLSLKLTPAGGYGAESIAKGLFTKELEEALLAGTIDVAIHSLKDLPTATPDGLALTGVLERANVADVLITKSAEGIAGLPHSAVIATSSVRRMRQLQWLRPDLVVEEVRGNVATRLRKLRNTARWEGMLLAQAGLERLGYALGAGELRVAFEHGGAATFRAGILSEEDMLPAVGQGAIALQTRSADKPTHDLLAGINHLPTFQRVLAERALLRGLGGGCQMPLGVSTRIEGDTLHMRAVYFDSDGPPRAGEAAGDKTQPEALARQLIDSLQHRVRNRENVRNSSIP